MANGHLPTDERVCPRRGRHLTEAHRLACPACRPEYTEVASGTIDANGIRFRLEASARLTNHDLRAVAALLVAAADRLERDPEALDTRIET